MPFMSFYSRILTRLPIVSVPTAVASFGRRVTITPTTTFAIRTLNPLANRAMASAAMAIGPVPEVAVPATAETEAISEAPPAAPTKAPKVQRTPEEAAAAESTVNWCISALPEEVLARRVPIPPNGVDYRGTIVLAPMVRSGELPARLLALKYGADLVWGPETVDHSLIGTTRKVNPRTGCIEWTRPPSQAHNKAGYDENVIFRIDPAREKGKLIFQIGTSDPDRCLTAARLVAGDVSGIDVNAGCPKPFSTTGGMGAALLQTPDKLVAILENLTRHIIPEFQIGVSVKIRLLETAEKTEALVRRLVGTGITGLTIHCRTTPMRPRERAIRGQLRMIGYICREAGVACVVNGDVADRADGYRLMEEFKVDGAMIATAAEKNPNVFLQEGQQRTLWGTYARELVRFGMEVENKLSNTKFTLSQIVPGKEPVYKKMCGPVRSYSELVKVLGFGEGEGGEEMVGMARRTDEILKLGEWEPRREEKKGKKAQPRQGQQNKGGNKKRKSEDELEGKGTKKEKVVVAEPVAQRQQQQQQQQQDGAVVAQAV
ncbi:putative tRNA-dihydrouridine synthase [Triangularia verruculosa]|uniref:tRNA-dihydrouridine synthase n=1 Tax=Triangularia verruculosa TaxID=2587418 RepID=A0AAN6X940_9PEZI|nr:putative tRNA-dihydrouridine synthase [Triangularia verruculosa]